MHFLAMLSLRFSVSIHYDLFQTLSSGLIAVLVVGFALLLLHFRPRTPAVLNTAGLSLGAGIVAMHFVGMSGMRGVIPAFSPLAVFAALLVALVMGVSAIRVSYGSRTRLNIVKGGVVFGLSVAVVHYTAMLGTRFSLDPEYAQQTIALDQGTLAIVVTVAAFVICGSFLLAASTFVPAVNPTEVTTGDGVRSDDIDHTSASTSPAPQTLMQQTDAPESSAELSVATSFPAVRIPFEEHKQISFVSSEEVGTIRAYGRYTQLYTRSGVKFCPWSITEAEKRLSSVRFYRSHRSYLINIPAVAGFEKNRDAGVCRFEGFAQLGNVPVSRARVGELVAELGL